MGAPYASTGTNVDYSYTMNDIIKEESIGSNVDDDKIDTKVADMKHHMPGLEESDLIYLGFFVGLVVMLLVLVVILVVKWKRGTWRFRDSLL